MGGCLIMVQATNSNKKNSNKKGFWANVKEITVLLLIVYLVRTFGFGLYVVPTPSMETTMLVGERFFADKFTVLFTDIKRGDIVSINEPLFKYSSNKLIKLFQKYVWGPSNWTKRVVGIPGDEIKGVVEDGKPVIYINGKKINEPYLNKYPLMQVWQKDLKDLQKIIQKNPSVNLGIYLSLKSYDPSKPFDKQPFHQIDKNRIFGDPTTGSPVMFEPGTPTKEKGKKIIRGESYWGTGDDFYVKLGKDEYWLMGDNRLGSSDARVFGPIKGETIHGRILFRVFSIDTDCSWLPIDFIKNPISFLRRIRWHRLFQRVK